MQRPEYKSPPERPLLSAETGNVENGRQESPRKGLFSIDDGFRSSGRLGGGGSSQIRTSLNQQFPANREFYWEFCDSGPQKPISLHETTVPQRLFTKFPTQNNRENILKNREFLSGNSESPARCVGTVDRHC